MKELTIILSLFAAIMLIVAYLNHAKRIHIENLFDHLYEERNELKCDQIKHADELGLHLRKIIEMQAANIQLSLERKRMIELLKSTARLIDQNGGDRYERSLKALVNIQEFLIEKKESKKIH